MFLPKLICSRGMARRVKPLKQLKVVTTFKKPGVGSKVNEVSSKKETISSGGSEIIINRKQSKQSQHHASNPTTFESLNIRPDVIEGLENLEIYTPTVIQLLGIPKVMEGKNVFCAAQTGSGKTSVYAVPIINRIRDAGDERYIGRLSRPRAIIVAPSAELASQILKVFKSFHTSAPFRSLGLIGPSQKKYVRDSLKGLVDVVVSTPETLLKYHGSQRIMLSDLEYIVFDEADTLFDENFKELTKRILDLCHFEENSMTRKRHVQCILTAATVPPKGIVNGYKTFIPNLELCQSNLHKVLPNIKHSFIKTVQSKKFELLIDRLSHFLQKSGQKCLVFCNTSKSCNWLSIKLTERNIGHSRLNGKMTSTERSKSYRSFIDGENDILVCTDIASRGLDISDATQIVNFDCPFNASDYIHRSGRTGRATETYTGKGEVVTFVTKNSEVSLAQKVQSAAEKNECLGEIVSKENKLETRYKKEIRNYMETAKRILKENAVTDENRT